MWKKVPEFWWDFEEEPMVVIVQSNHPKYPVVGRFAGKGQYLDKEISLAEDLIADLREGRKNIREEYNKTKQELEILGLICKHKKYIQSCWKCLNTERI